MKRKLNKLSELWHYSTIKQESPNLVIQCEVREKEIFVNIGVYSFDPIKGTDKVSNIIPKMPYKVAHDFLRNHQYK